jgi:hypothetical protein
VFFLAFLDLLLKFHPELVNNHVIGEDERLSQKKILEPRLPMQVATEQNCPALLRKILSHPDCDIWGGGFERILSHALLNSPSPEIVRIVVEELEARSSETLRKQFVYESQYGKTTSILVLLKSKFAVRYKTEVAEILDYLIDKGCPVDGPGSIGRTCHPP